MSESVIDPQVFNEMRELMEDALGTFIETYLDNSPKLMDSIDQALASGDLETIFHQAHQLKGGSGSIGAMQVFQLAKEMEEQARNGQGEGLDDMFKQLQAAYSAASEELKEHI